MSLIQVTNLTFGYDGSYDMVFEDASFQLDTAWRLGLVGRNGRGKTTLLRLLCGQLEYRGRISATVDFEYFPFPVAQPEADGLAVAQAACPGVELWALERELALLDLDSGLLARPFNLLSNGEQTKLLLAALFLKDNAFLLIDEPTNHLDRAAREKVSAYLRRKDGYILVSHDRAFLDGCVDHILSINRQDIQVQRGNFSSWMENKRREDEHELAENARLQKDIKRLTAAARQTADWSDKVESSKRGSRNSGLRPDRGYIGHKAAKMMKRSKGIEQRREDAVADKSTLLRNIDSAEALKLHPLTFHSRRLVELTDVGVRYGDRQIFSDLTLTLEQGDRVALRGKNGAGKTSLLKLIMGQDVPHSGQVRVGSGLRISYVSQRTDTLSGRLRDYAEAEGVDGSLLMAILHKLDFTKTQFEKDMGAFSQGQKKKVLIARSLCQQAHLYIWDEPLNYIDVLSRIQIEALLIQHCPTLLFVEHDQAFCENVATRTIPLK